MQDLENILHIQLLYYSTSLLSIIYITRLKSLRSLYPNFQQILLLLPRNQMPLRKRKFDEVSQDRTFANFVKSLHTDDIPEDEFETYLTTKITHPPELELQSVLDWWKNNSRVFQGLSQMARDVFAVPCTGAGVECEFSKG